MSYPDHSGLDFVSLDFFGACHSVTLGICQEGCSWGGCELCVEPLVEPESGIKDLSGSMLPPLLKNQTVVLAKRPKTGKTTATAILFEFMVTLPKSCSCIQSRCYGSKSLTGIGDWPVSLSSTF